MSQHRQPTYAFLFVFTLTTLVFLVSNYQSDIGLGAPLRDCAWSCRIRPHSRHTRRLNVA